MHDKIRAAAIKWADEVESKLAMLASRHGANAEMTMLKTIKQHLVFAGMPHKPTSMTPDSPSLPLIHLASIYW